MKPDLLLNRRVIFKLHGMDPLDATILRQDAHRLLDPRRHSRRSTRPIQLLRGQ